jgi:hypothetical protein
VVEVMRVIKEYEKMGEKLLISSWWRIKMKIIFFS